jgi:hypothetical protein
MLFVVVVDEGLVLVTGLVVWMVVVEREAKVGTKGRGGKKERKMEGSTEHICSDQRGHAFARLMPVCRQNWSGPSFFLLVSKSALQRYKPTSIPLSCL